MGRYLQFAQKAIEYIQKKLRGRPMDNLMSENDGPKLSEEVKNQIRSALEQRGALNPCPRCGNRGFVLADGILASPIQENLEEFVLGSSIPSAVVICNHCGYMSLHALGVLGLMDLVRGDDQSE